MGQRQRTGDLSRTVGGQWSKSEKRSAANRKITEANRSTHQILRNFAQKQSMK